MDSKSDLSNLFGTTCDETLLEHAKKMQSLPPSSNNSYIENVGYIDEQIAPLIAWLNQNRLYTLASCSGLEKDHGRKLNSGYISFDYDKISPEKRELLYKKLSLIGQIIEGESYFRKSFTIYFKEEQLKLLESVLIS